MPAALPVSFAAVLTPPILVVTSWVASAVCETLRAISAVAAPCSSIAAPIEVAIRLTSSMVAVMPPMASTASLVAPWICAILSPISRVASAVWLASDFTSEATTAKPRPASPARAASMVALSASRLVCAAMLEISSATCSICWAPSERARTMVSVRRALSTARPVTSADCAT
ncbi:hypothetical protein ACVWW4_001201 [Bradyrhizobium sp. LB7.1]